MSIEIKVKGELNNFFEKYKAIHLKKGECFLKPGEPINFIGYIKSGFVRMYTINEYGQEITVPFFKSLMSFTTVMVMTQSENKFYFEALTQAEIYKVPKNEALEYFRNSPEVSNEIMKNVSLSFLGVVEEMGMMLSGNAYNKVAATLESLIGKVEFPVTHKLIASLTGLTRETVTLQLLKLEKEGVIAKDKRKMRIVDGKRLLRAMKQQ